MDTMYLPLSVFICIAYYVDFGLVAADNSPAYSDCGSCWNQYHQALSKCDKGFHRLDKTAIAVYDCNTTIVQIDKSDKTCYCCGGIGSIPYMSTSFNIGTLEVRSVCGHRCFDSREDGLRECANRIYRSDKTITTKQLCRSQPNDERIEKTCYCCELL